jgi:hypothetical protein
VKNAWFVEHLAHKKHNLGSDTLAYALTAAANPPTTSYTGVSNLTEISYTNCSSRSATTSSSGQTAGTYKLVLADQVLTASGTVGPFRYVVLFNDTPSGGPTDPIIGWYDYGSDLTLSNGETFTVDNDSSNGVLQLA